MVKYELEITKRPEVERAEQIVNGLVAQRQVFKDAGLKLNDSTYMETEFLFRRDFMQRLLDPKHDIDKECGYPYLITDMMYHQMVERFGIASRVVSVYPDESWSQDPEIYEDPAEDVETDFETAWNELLTRLNLWGVLHRADILSGVGRFGVVLLGLDDGKPYDQIVDGINERGEKTKVVNHKLLFTRVFEEYTIRVDSRCNDVSNPRFGQPIFYTLTFRDIDIGEPAGAGMSVAGMLTRRVHWSRVIHLADNLGNSEMFGRPRCKPVWDRLVDLRKIYSSSGEMFWQGAFPGFALEVQPGVGESDVDQESIKKEMHRYSSGLQRFLAMGGMTVKSLEPEIESPADHIQKQIEFICITLAVPLRVFLGSEEAKLAGNQDTKAWNRRLAQRQTKYITPRIVRPTVDRLILVGVLPEPKTYTVAWTDLAAVSDKERADTALVQSQAIAQYVASAGDQIMPPEIFLEVIMGMDPDKVEAAIAGAREAVSLETSEPASAVRGVGTPKARRAGTTTKVARPPRAAKGPGPKGRGALSRTDK